MTPIELSKLLIRAIELEGCAAYPNDECSNDETKARHLPLAASRSRHFKMREAASGSIVVVSSFGFDSSFEFRHSNFRPDTLPPNKQRSAYAAETPGSHLREHHRN